MATAYVSAKEKTSGGVIYLYVEYALRFVYLVPLLLLWRSLFSNGVEVGMTLAQMLSYTYLSILLDEMLNVSTPATAWFVEGIIISLYQRPMSIFGHLAAQTVGGWLPKLLLFSLPMVIVSPLLGISLIPQTIWFLPSLIMTVSLGFAIDFLFACLMIRVRNATWLAHMIRMAIIAIFSGSMIPFALLPWGIGKVLQYLPFGSLAGAPLSLFTGITDPQTIIPLQIVWNAVLWPLAIWCFRRSSERMVSYGG